jgi:hypothetical protein
MNISELKHNQLKQIFCAAMGWWLHLDDRKPTSKEFDDLYESIEIEWDTDRWSISNKYTQIEITESLFFRCGTNFVSNGIGGQAFDLKAVFDCLKSYGVLDN